MPHNVKQKEREEIISKNMAGASLQLQGKINEILRNLSDKGRLGLHDALEEILIKDGLLIETEDKEL